jgi:hypothetical protein
LLTVTAMYDRLRTNLPNSMYEKRAAVADVI